MVSTTYFLCIILSFSWTIPVTTAFFLDKLPDLPKIPDVITDPLDKIVFRNKCMEDLGCFYTGPPFYHPVLRPISLAPFDLKDMKTNFWLFTRSNNKMGNRISVDSNSLENSPFEKGLPVKFLVHGYLTSLEEGDARFRMKDALLKEGDYNVIIVDWTNSNGGVYMQAVANTRVVGAQTAQMIKFLQVNVGTDVKDVHLIGHSLGAHICGFAGERTPNLARISGLDPAGPYFRHGEQKIRLDTTDAEFVDIIHTDIGKLAVEGLGIKEPIGHLDFFPNGGWHQHGCEPTLLNFSVVGIDITAVGSGEGLTTLLATSCDHNRANELYIASIDDSSCQFMGVQCKNYDLFEKHNCKTGRKIEMGFHAVKNPKIPEGLKFFLDTSNKFPFCVQNVPDVAKADEETAPSNGLNE